MKVVLTLSLPICLLSLLSVSIPDASGALPPKGEREMEADAVLVVSGKVTALSSKTQKARSEGSSGSDFLIARDRIFQITLEVSSVSKGKGVKTGDEVKFQAWQPSTRFPPLPGPQGHQPVPGKGDLVKAYFLFNEKTKTYHPFMPNGIKILKKAKISK